MPTAQEYRDAAEAFNDLADDIGPAFDALEALWRPTTVSGGALEQRFKGGLLEGDEDSRKIRSLARSLAGECEWRATQCDLYTAAWQEYRRTKQLGGPGATTADEPPKLYFWLEES